jgi:hypothetical protein
MSHNPQSKTFIEKMNRFEKTLEEFIASPESKECLVAHACHTRKVALQPSGTTSRASTWREVGNESSVCLTYGRLHDGQDLIDAGFPKEQVLSVGSMAMEQLVREMRDDYCNQLFWGHLRILAEPIITENNAEEGAG